MTVLRNIRKKLIKTIRFFLRQERVFASDFNYVLEAASEDIEYIIRSNIVLKVTKNNENLYFRHCFTQMPMRDFVKFFIEYYFKHLTKKDVVSRKTRMIIENNLKARKNYKKFIKMGCWKNENDPSGKYVFGGFDSSIVGIIYNSSCHDEELKDFVKFASVMLENWKMNNWFGKKKGCVQAYHANIEFAYHQITSVFGIEYLVPTIWFGYLSIDGDKYFGYFMKEIKGEVANSYPKDQRASMISPLLQMDLNNIFIVDYVCGVYDHAPHNYNILVNEEGTIEKIGFFDNNEGGAFPIYHSKPRYVSPLISSKQYNRPFISSQIMNRIFSIKKEDLFQVNCKYLSRARIFFCWRRIKILKKVLNKNKSKPQILEPEEWDLKTISDELSGAFGRTYLNLFLENGK